MSKKNAKTFGAQVNPAIQQFLDQAQSRVNERREKDQTDPVTMPGSTTFINELIIHSKGGAAIVDHLYPPRVQITGNEEGASHADTSMDAPLTIKNPRIPDVPTLQHEEPPTPADPMAPAVVVDHRCPLAGPTVFPEPKSPVNVTPTPTPITTGRRHLRDTAIFGLGLSLLILALSANRDTAGGSALSEENEQLRARLAAIDVAAQNQAAKAVTNTTASNTVSVTAKSTVESTTDAATIGEFRAANTALQDRLNFWEAAKPVIDARLDKDAKTIEDLRANNTELRDKLMTWEKKEPLIVARLKADTETIVALSRENAALKSTHTRFGPEVVVNPGDTGEGRP
jgi:hypothetical protein